MATAAARSQAKADAQARARARAKEKARAKAKAKAKAHAKAKAKSKADSKAAPKACVTTPATKHTASSKHKAAAKKKASTKHKSTAKRHAKASAAKPTPTTKGGKKAAQGKGCAPPKPTAKKPASPKAPAGAGFVPTPAPVLVAPAAPVAAFTPAPAAAAGVAAAEAATQVPVAPPVYPPSTGAELPVPAPPGLPAPAGPTAPTPPAAPDWGPAQAERLLWRAGFGPGAGDVDRLVALGKEAAVRSLVHPVGDAKLVGPAPRTQDGTALAPGDLAGHDHLWWMDRMIRSDQPLVERMTLVWHDWFATSNDAMPQGQLIAQNLMMRRGALGSFRDLTLGVTRDPAMLMWLNGIANTRWTPNENYGRELMELFTLGANRGAYTEPDVREMARALTGWIGTWPPNGGWVQIRYEPEAHDDTEKTIFGQTGRFDETDAVRLAIEHPLHASFFVRKLWSAFIPTAPDPATQARLEALYVGGGHQIAPVVEQILLHPDLYEGEVMVKPPVVFIVGLLRALGRGIDTDIWPWICRDAGQLLFSPPNVSGWDETRWLDTATWRGRWELAMYALLPTQPDTWSPTNPYSATESAGTAVANALASLGKPRVSPEFAFALEGFSASALPADMPPWGPSPYRAMRYSALRLLIASSPDAQIS